MRSLAAIASWGTVVVVLAGRSASGQEAQAEGEDLAAVVTETPSPSPTPPYDDAHSVSVSPSSRADGAAQPTPARASAVYPDRITLVSALTEEPSAYPFGIPPRMTLTLGPGRALSAAEREDLRGALDAQWRKATVTVLGGERAGMEVDIGGVAVPTAWREEDLAELDVINCTSLMVESPETDALAQGAPVADIAKVDDATYAGSVVAGPGVMTLAFPFAGLESEPGVAVGIQLGWEGPLECVLVDPLPPAAADADQLPCEDKDDDTFWDWGVASVWFG